MSLSRQTFIPQFYEKGVVAWVGAYGEQGKSYTNSLFTIKVKVKSKVNMTK
jgi:apolipoprotein N-acyltransferase